MKRTKTQKKELLDNLWINKKSKRFIHVKEITYWANSDNREGNEAYIVTGDDCIFPADAHTNVVRKCGLYSSFIMSGYEKATYSDIIKFDKRRIFFM